MPLWKLEPIDRANSNWAASTYKNEIIVRAEDLSKAQDLAANAYGTIPRVRSGETTTIMNPWHNPGFVRTIQVQATDDYTEDGDQEIVYPPEAVTSAKPGYKLA